MKTETEFIVKYADVDRMNRVYYARYLEYFEVGRTDYLKKNFTSYKKLEDEYKIYLPVIEVNVKYLLPIEYETVLKLITDINILNSKIFEFQYNLFANDILVAKAYTKHVFVDELNNIIKWNDFLTRIKRR